MAIFRCSSSRLCLLPFLLGCSVAAASSLEAYAPAEEDGPFFSVRAFGAVGDGTAKDTAALQKAIDTAGRAGGGTVVLPAGRYLSGTLFLRSHVRLHLEGGAVLLASPEIADYPETLPAERSYTDNYVRHSLLYAEGLENLAITGLGTIDGQGENFRWREYRDRPFLLRFIRCHSVLVEGVTFRNSAMWMQHYLACDDLRIDGIRVFNHATYNNDGLDLDGCHNVRVSNSSFDTDDDALVVKSTLDRESRDITITNCVLSSHCNALKMGTESNGGFRNITISNCVIRSPQQTTAIYGSQRGLAGVALEIVDGGKLDQVAISNITIEGVSVPLFLRLGNRARPFSRGGPVPSIGSFRNVSIDGVLARGVSRIGCSITGLPGHPVENVALRNLRIEFDGGGTREDALRAVPEKEDQYPESSMFGTLPAYGFYCRHVENLDLSDISLTWRDLDERPALVCEDVRELTVDGLKARTTSESLPLIVLTNVDGSLIRGCSLTDPGGVFLRATGESRNLTVIGNDLRRARTPFELDATPLPGFFESGNRTSVVPTP